MVYDPCKDLINQSKHGLSLCFGERVIADPDQLEISSFREVDNEKRWKSIGKVDGKLYTAVFTYRGNGRRFISVRRSNRNEERQYRHFC